MTIDIITIFPRAFSFLDESIPKRAQEKGTVEINIIDLKKYGLGKWNKVDDKPYGGGAGMLMMVEPIYNCLKDIGAYPKKSEKERIYIMSARGENWNQSKAEKSLDLDRLVLICGHYEGADQRVVDNFVDEEVSIGNYILSGGELAAQVITDSIVRLIPGVVGNEGSIARETAFGNGEKRIEHPHYTKPEVFKTDDGEELIVPSVLLSGNHAEIEKWREESTKELKVKG